jgi:nucleotide-binding universal stress UspA family protein
VASSPPKGGVEMSELPPEVTMLAFKKILWPNDFSESAFRALPYVKAFIEKHGSEVHLIYVAEDLANYGHYWGEPNAKHVEHLHDFAPRGARKKLEEFCSSELAACPLYQIHVVLGDPASEILEAIRELEIDLVVISIQGMRGHFPVGSVADKLIKHSPAPLLTLNPDIHPGGTGNRDQTEIAIDKQTEKGI